MVKIIRNIREKIKKEARKYFAVASGCHDWTHIERVRNLALRIGRKEKANLEILEIAAYLHDIGRKDEMEKKGIFCHAERSAELSRPLLKKYKLHTEVIENIIHCIESHRFRKNKKPATLEARVLFDADKLDSIGAVGVGRDFLFAGNAGSKVLYTGNEKRLAKTGKDYGFTKEDSAILEYEIKLKYLKNKMLTKEGKRIAQDRHAYMKKFFERFWQEVEGKK